MKILIIQTSFIGDVVLATGIAEKLHNSMPDAEIDFLVRKGNEGLFENHPWLKRILIWDKKNGKYKNLFRLLKQIRFTQYDKVINLQRFGASGFLTAFSGAKETRGFEKNPFSFMFNKSFPHIIGADANGKYEHEINRNHQLIADFTDGIAAKPRLYPSANDFEKVRQYKNTPYITIAPASVWFTKQYHVQKWIEFADEVTDQKIYLLGGKGDIGLCNDIISGSKNKNIEILAGKLSYLETTALMKDALMNYTNDSAPMHFASSVNAPIAAIFCSTIPQFGFGPLSDKSTIIQIREELSCRPCGLHGRKSCPQGHFKCAYDIKTQELVDLLRKPSSP